MSIFPVEKVTVGCFPGEGFKFYGLLNAWTTLCSNSFEKKNYSGKEYKNKKGIFFKRIKKIGSDGFVIQNDFFLFETNIGEYIEKNEISFCISHLF